jgi:hypothetical protein
MSEFVEPSTWRYAVIAIRTQPLRSIGRFGLVWPRSAIARVLQHGVTAAIVFFYSKNILSATVRAFVSF